jgi:type IV pilus assembly protein PilQ
VPIGRVGRLQRLPRVSAAETNMSRPSDSRTVGRRSRVGIVGVALAVLVVAVIAATADEPQQPMTAGSLPIDPAMIEKMVSSILQSNKELTVAAPSAGSPRASAPPTDAPAGPARPADIHVNAIGTVDINVSNMEVTDVLRMISQQTRKNIVASKNVHGAVSASLYGVTLDRALEVILAANGFGFRRDGDVIYVHTREELAEIGKNESRPVTRVFILHYLTAKDAETLVSPLLSPDGKVARTPAAAEGLASTTPNGGSTQGTNIGGDNHANADAIVVVDYPSHIEQIASVLREFDVRPSQVLIEATILRATLDEANALGIDFTTVGGIDFQQLNSISPAAQSIATGLTPQPMLNDTTFTVRTNFNQNVPAGGFTFGIIKDSVGFFIRALEQITDVTVLANPKLLALNKQKGEFIVGSRDGYLTTTITETTAIQTVEFLETGTRLLFRPFICGDGTIRMEIHPEDSTGGLTASNLPFKRTTEVTTNIMVRDGHTILIGGLFREVSNSTRSQVPFLGNIPGAGALFRSTDDAMTREEIIILLTVHIVKGEPEEKAGAELRDDTERYRIGQRREAQWLGRERLSQSYYHWALQHLSRGDLAKALRDANMAARTDPHQLEAMELRDLLQNRRTWDEEASAVRHLLYNLINEESGGPRPDFGRPAPPFKIPEGFEGPAGTEDGEHELEETAISPPTESQKP